MVSYASALIAQMSSDLSSLLSLSESEAFSEVIDANIAKEQ